MVVSYKMDTLKCDVPLDVDVYELLWRSRVRVYMPETVVFKYGRLEHWFFSVGNHKKGHLPKIKRKRDITVRRGDVFANIVESFCAGASDQDLVATWISGEAGEPCNVLHLTCRSLQKFLAHQKSDQKGHGVLQRWSAPFGGHSTTLRTDWSPHYFSLEMCTNWMLVNDQRRPIHERLATFEGNCRQITTTSVVNENLHAKVQQLNDTIAKKITDQQDGAKVWRLQCNFKPCADGGIAFMWCSKLVLEETDNTGFAIDHDEEDYLSSVASSPRVLKAETPASIYSGTSSIYSKLGKDEVFHSPRARKWDGKSIERDGTIFHIPNHGMTNFREPTWWGANRLTGITQPLPEPPLGGKTRLGPTWQMASVQSEVYTGRPLIAPSPRQRKLAAQAVGDELYYDDDGAASVTSSTEAIFQKVSEGHILSPDEMQAMKSHVEEQAPLLQKLQDGHMLTPSELESLKSQSLLQMISEGHMPTVDELETLKSHAEQQAELLQMVTDGHMLSPEELERLKAHAAASSTTSVSGVKDGSQSAREPSLPPLLAGSTEWATTSAVSARSYTSSVPPRGADGRLPHVPRSMARAVQMYHSGTLPTSLHKPRGMFDSQVKPRRLEGLGVRPSPRQSQYDELGRDLEMGALLAMSHAESLELSEALTMSEEGGPYRDFGKGSHGQAARWYANGGLRGGLGGGAMPSAPPPVWKPSPRPSPLAPAPASPRFAKKTARPQKVFY